VIAKVDVDQSPNKAVEYGIASIPRYVLFKRGKPVRAAEGGKTKDQLLDWIAGAD
jgi:thioredoxin 1